MKLNHESEKYLWNFDLRSFLDSCKISSQQTFENLKKILKYLEDPITRVKARCAFTEIYQYFLSLDTKEDIIKIYNFTIDKLIIDGNELSPNSLYILQLPSIFFPEDWSFTFYEGLVRCSESEFHHRTIAELGCGNGWISIALAKKTAPHQIYGLDINPKAIICAKINLFLNALDNKGNTLIDSEGKSILDRVQFHYSDLLEYCLTHKVKLDKVIGCIPQVLAPDSSVIPNIVPQDLTDESLYALSNYCAKQGYIEDQFGLGLIARAVEESIELMKSSGKIILNLGGRPGKAVLERLFTRRGFKTNIIWQTKIQQAGDTEILPLVEIEKNSSYRFEFFMGSNSQESISARTAYFYTQNFGKIFHSLHVLEAEMRDFHKMKKILTLLKKDKYFAARSGLDLTYGDRSLVDEKMSFLAKLADKLKNDGALNYENVKGDSSFRRHIAEYFRTYWRVPITAKCISIAPSRSSIIKNIFSIYDIKKAIVEKDLFKELPEEWLTNDNINENQNVNVIESPKQCELVCKLIATLLPDLVITGLSDLEVRNQDAFIRLIETTEKYNCRLVVDFSNGLELTSFPKGNGIFDFLSENVLPSHVTLICGFIYNKIYSDLEVAFLYSENESFVSALSNSSELTYSRTSVVLQEYYNNILFDLLSFHVRNSKRGLASDLRSPVLENLPFQDKFPGFSLKCKNSFAHISIKDSHHNVDSKTVRLDYGENCYPVPEFVKASVFEGFVRQNISNSELLLENEILKLLYNRFGINSIDANKIVLGNGISSLFASVCEFCAEKNYSLLLPDGSYGFFEATAMFYGCELISFKTYIKDDFKISAVNLEKTLAKETKPVWIFLNAPIVNPTGAKYSLEECEQIFQVAEKFKSYVIIDTIFSELEYQKEESCYNVQSLVSNKFPNLKFLLMGGLSKELSSGGLRIGFGYSASSEILMALRKNYSHQLPVTIRFAARKIFAILNNNDFEVSHHYQRQSQFLQERSKKLKLVLSETGWEVLKSYGGLFLIAKPTYILGKALNILSEKENHLVYITESNICDILYKQFGLLINGPQWTRLPGFCRFVLSVSDHEFESALEKLKLFWNSIIKEA
ncbi:MAG: aminotransferase class I/II-fold pyridoxal phosphate-dependent enzyme [Spirobacillus cienkowskii]|jgi:methionine S-methyltransferase|uniref:Aminotransferase class I/II-fold pyridoxal phosphate-dependent enzyme n=1 Tax=Spirobacillus cienkowskii TaxID=495820 RepID=A0A369L0P3_9BACT|nr:MAG: aminotransferase class I/II-fold pyridoxal phosphate-dependent enzyme [Spirobacillus cienkowskii]